MPIQRHRYPLLSPSIKEIIERLVEAGFDVNDQDFFGRTPLHWACLSENSHTVEYLVEHGADLTIRTLTQKTPVHLCFALMLYINNQTIIDLYPEAFFDAVQRYDRESLRYFFKHVSNKEAVMLRNEQGCSALHIAVKAGRSGISAPRPRL